MLLGMHTDEDSCVAGKIPVEDKNCKNSFNWEKETVLGFA